ncbi:glycosyltransferase family 2 protein, partial [Vibrio breoganii]|uniref:glycosyltransferase family 2 protein n=1 Tax=Vibrio breoganii TaxID=553239 RepID=UPI00105674E4
RVVFLENSTRKKGAGSCRNIALEQAKGDWILFADSDDVFIEDAFNIIDSYLLMAEDTSLDIVYFSPKSKNQNGASSLRHLRYSNLVNDYIESGNDAIRYQFYVPWSKLIRAHLIKSNNIKFDEVIASNDVMFSALVGHFAKKIECTTDSIY